MKLLKLLLILVLIVVVGLVLARNIAVKTAVEIAVPAFTGLPVTIEKLDVGLTKTYINIEGLVVKNPEGFHDTSLVEIPKILVDYDLSAVLKGKIHLENLEFDLKQFSVVKNEKGKINLDSLKPLKRAEQPAKPASEQKGKMPPIQIDFFHLKVGKASYVDFSGGQAATQDFNVGLDEQYKDITDPNKLIALIVVKVMMRTPLAMLSGFNLGGLQGSVSGILGSATDMASQAAGKALDTFKAAASSTGVAESTVKEAAGTVTSGVKSTASSVKSKLKNLF